MSAVKNIRKFVADLPGARASVRFLRKCGWTASRPLLDFLLKAHRYDYNGWDVITDKNCAFKDDPQFIKGYDAANAQHYLPMHLHWIMHVNQWAVAHAFGLPGDFVECGVNRARLTRANMAYLGFNSQTQRTYYLFDTFCGLDPEFATPKELDDYKHAYGDCYQYVKDSFKDFPNVVLVKGAIPKTLNDAAIERVAYLAIDMNCVVPEIEAIRFFWPKMVPGGIVVLDDYAHRGHESQKEAFDQFAHSAGVKVLTMPTGQGIMLKR